MKKFLLLTIFFALSFLTVSKSVSAQNVLDYHICTWTDVPVTGEPNCTPDISASSCPTGFEYNAAACADATSSSQCKALKPECVEIDLPPEYNWSIITIPFAHCVPMEDGPYETYQECQAALVTDPDDSTCGSFVFMGTDEYNNQVSFRATSCDPDQTYYTVIFNPAGNQVTAMNMNYTYVPVYGDQWVSDGRFTTYKPGVYTAQIAIRDEATHEYTLLNSVQFTVQIPPDDEDDGGGDDEGDGGGVIEIDNCGTAENPGIPTAIGCISFADPLSLSVSFITVGAGIAGGIALLMIAYAAFQIMTSSGDPTKLRSSQELLVAAIGGILIITLSTLILRVFGVNILGLF